MQLKDGWVMCMNKDLCMGFLYDHDMNKVRKYKQRGFNTRLHVNVWAIYYVTTYCKQF